MGVPRRRGRRKGTLPLQVGAKAPRLGQRRGLRALAARAPKPARPGRVAYYFAYAPEGASLAELAGAAGLRWTIEECFLRAKDDLGLDHCEARSWHGWHRHITLVMIAAAFLARLSADQRRRAFGKGDKRSPDALAAA